MIEILAQIRSGRFTAGIVLWDDKVIEAAPIVGYMKKQKWARDRVRDYCAAKGWQISIVHETQRKDVDAQGRAAVELRASGDEVLR